MSDIFVTALFAVSPFILVALMVFWVYTIHTRLSALQRDIAQNNQAIVQTFSQMDARVNALSPKGDINASAPEAS